LARPWALLGSFGAALGRSWCALGDASSRKFSKLRLLEQIFFDLGSVWARKPAKSCKKTAKSMRKFETSAANQTSDSNEGAAVARSELNPPHPAFTQRAKRLKHFAECRTPGELASPYPSTGLRESAAPHLVRIFFWNVQNPFCFWPPKSPPSAVFGGLKTALERSWLRFACMFAENRFRRAVLGDLGSNFS